MNEGRNLSQNPKKLYHKRLLTRRSDPSHQWLLHSLPWNQAKTQHPLITYSTDGRCHPLAGVGVANGVPTDHFLPKLRQTAYVALGFSTGIWKPQGFPSQLVPEDFGMDFTAASPRQGTWHHPSPPDEAVFKLDLNQWIGLRENLQESPIFNGKIYGFRLRFSLKPIHWMNSHGKSPCLMLKSPFLMVKSHGNHHFLMVQSPVSDGFS